MNDGSIIPERNAAGLPLPAHREIVGCVHVFAQEVQRMNGLLILELGNMDDIAGVVEQGLELCHGVSADLHR